MRSSMVRIATLAFALGVPGAGLEAGVQETDPKPYSLDAAQLRCWQNGELIFAEDGWKRPLSTDETRITRFEPTGRHRGVLYLIDLERATCLLKGE